MRYVATGAIREAVKGHEAAILTALGIQWTGTSRHIRCPYPDHADNHPSWRWDSVKGRGHCTCTPSHSIFDVICKVKGIGFDAAKIEAAEIIGRSDLIRRRGDRKKEREGVKTPTDNTATAQHPTGCTLADYANVKNLDPEALKSFGVTEVTYNGRPALRVPYCNSDGNEVAVRFRIAVEDKDKFRWRKRDKPLLYGLQRTAAARNGGEITLVEGESDCHTLWNMGFHAIGLPGAGNWNEERDAAAFEGFGTIYVVIEPDNGGSNVLKWLSKSKIRDRVKLVRLVGFKDSSALYLDDPARFAERWRAALVASVLWQDEAEKHRQTERDTAWNACRELANCPDILTNFVLVNRTYGIVGEERIIKLIYLAVTSRVLLRIVSLAVKGPSSGGKSYIVDSVLKFFPAEAYYVLTAMSDHALAYGLEPLSHRFIVLYEAAGLAGDFGTYLVRSLLSEGRICYDTVEKTKDGLKARRIEREGPTGLITTTTAVGLHPENETRLLSANVADTPEQTKLIMKAQAGRQGRAQNINVASWHALQRAIALEPASVAIPFAQVLADLIPPVAVRLRRDYPTVLALIEAHALLHQASRERNADGAVIATLEDYSAVREIVEDLISQGVGATVSVSLRQTVGAVGELQKQVGADSVSITSLGQKLNLDKSAASRRAKEATAKGYLKNLEDRRGRPAKLVLGDPLPGDVEVLPRLETIKARCCTVAPMQQGDEPPPSQKATEEEMAWTVKHFCIAPVTLVSGSKLPATFSRSPARNKPNRS